MVLCRLFQRGGNGIRLVRITIGADGSGNVITSIYAGDEYLTSSILAIDVHVGSTTHISHTGTTKDAIHLADAPHRHRGITLHLSVIAATIHITTNLNLRLRRQAHKSHKSHKSYKSYKSYRSHKSYKSHRSYRSY